ncbi:MAG: class I SAM-dependent methyltransferase [Alphaproteobacteria bacterium]|nr:class I SAM-dependent methyltransferase [Alphaproteobacteria bacterium]
MPILNRLVDVYEKRGFEIATGLNASHFDDFTAAPFTWLMRDGRSFTNGLGITIGEVYFLECLLADLAPLRIFVIGNSFGWSTLALALLAPQAKVVAIDAGFDENSLEGISLTNRIASEEGLDVTVVEATAPQDVAAVIAEHLDGAVDFALIDGKHTNEQIVLDFDAVRACAAPHCAYLFHDVFEFSLQQGFSQNQDTSGLSGGILRGTTSGMGLLYDVSRTPAVAQTVATFTISESAMAVVRQGAWNRRHRTIAKYRKSLAKRRNTLRGWLGKSPLPLP